MVAWNILYNFIFLKNTRIQNYASSGRFSLHLVFIEFILFCCYTLYKHTTMGMDKFSVWTSVLICSFRKRNEKISSAKARSDFPKANNKTFAQKISRLHIFRTEQVFGNQKCSPLILTNTIEEHRKTILGLNSRSRNRPTKLANYPQNSRDKMTNNKLATNQPLQKRKTLYSTTSGK